jgi:hypothetical protein
VLITGCVNVLLLQLLRYVKTFSFRSPSKILRAFQHLQDDLMRDLDLFFMSSFWVGHIRNGKALYLINLSSVDLFYADNVPVRINAI